MNKKKYFCCQILFYMTRTGWICCLFFLILSSCTELSDLSSDTSLASFHVEKIMTPDVEFGSPILSDSTVVIPLVYGKYAYPISFKARITANSSALKITGINPDSITFKESGDQLNFFVVAENGKVHSYKLILREEDRSNHAEIDSLIVTAYTPKQSIVASISTILGLDTIVKIIAPETTFPFSITPTIYLSDSAFFTTYTAGSPLLFANTNDKHIIAVEASDGLRKNWSIKLEQGTKITDNSLYSTSELKAVDFNNSNLSATLSASTTVNQHLKRLDFDSETNTIYCNLQPVNTTLQFPISLKFQFTLPDHSSVINYKTSDYLSFTDENTTHYLFLYDRQRDQYKKWKIVCRTWENNEANVTSFKLLQTTPSTVKIDASNTQILAEYGVITLTVDEGISQFPLTLKANLTLSENATTNFVNGESVIFRSILSSYSFSITAQNGTVKNWQIKLVSASDETSKADVNYFTVTNYTSLDNRVQLNPLGVIDKTAKTITLEVTDDAAFFPLSLNAKMITSLGATFSQNAFAESDLLTFNTINSTYDFRLTSEDGSTTNLYHIRFVKKESSQSDAAQLISFSVAKISDGYNVQNINIDYETQTISLNLSSVGTHAFIFTPVVNISPRAELDGIISGTSIAFNSLNDTRNFYIISESGNVRNTWKIEASITPQLTNYTLESWENTSTPLPLNYWGTANNSFSTGTTRDTRNNGYCAKMTTTSVLGNIAAGSLFLGYLQMDLNQINNPKMMSYFGIPFSGRPTAVTLDIKFTPQGGDKASIELHLLNYEGTNFEYHTLGTESGITIVGNTSQYLISNQTDWITVTIPIIQTSSLPVTHIHFVATTSYRGDELIGTVGTTLWVDNIRLNY